MTKEKIIDCITNNKSSSCVAVGEDLKPIESTRLYQLGVVEIKATADELLALIEQEKEEIAREILDDLKGLLEGYIHTNENTTLYEYYCKKYGVKS